MVVWCWKVEFSSIFNIYEIWVLEICESAGGQRRTAKNWWLFWFIVAIEIIAIIIEEVVVIWFLLVDMQVMRILHMQKQDVSMSRYFLDIGHGVISVSLVQRT